MLKTKVVEKELNYICFLGATGGFIVIAIMIYGITKLSTKPLAETLPITLFFIFILLLPTSFLFWFGFLPLWESINNGENAIKRFWKRYKKGILPKLWFVATDYENAVEYKRFQFSKTSGIFKLKY